MTIPPKTPPRKPRKAPAQLAAKAAARRLAPPKASAREAHDAKPAVSAKAAWSIGAIVLAAGAGLAAFLTRGRIVTLLATEPEEGHAPADLLDPTRNVDTRPAADFRPDMDAPMSVAECEALRPATVPAPSLVGDRGVTNAQTAPAY